MKVAGSPSGWPFVERYVFRRYSMRRFAAADDQSAAPGIYPTMVPELAIRYVIGIPQRANGAFLSLALSECAT